MPDPVLIFGAACLLLVVAVVLVIVNAARRSRKGREAIQRQGWEQLPDDPAIVADWVGWPFVRELEGGTVAGAVRGDYDGAPFMSLRWSQSEPGGKGSEIERYNLVAIGLDGDFPPFSLSSNPGRMERYLEGTGLERFETGDERFDRGWGLAGDADFGRAVLTPEVREALDAIPSGLHDGYSFQRWWAVRVTRWTFWPGEDAMLDELDTLASVLRLVPHEVWRQHGGRPPRLPSGRRDRAPEDRGRD